ncbi:MAG: uroporphyrinogen decarboxylase family protein [Phycisphaeraceae bacterium]|nr:uroporphyrinogen decarboxylase family protein [Phycisphaeraceae bacterium]
MRYHPRPSHKDQTRANKGVPTTMMTTLTSCQRVVRAMERRDHDRVPRFDAFWDETLERWRREGLTGDPADWFDFDIVTLGHMAPVPFPGRNEIIREDEDTVDHVNEYGATFREWKNRSGVPEHLGFECANPDVWQRAFKPRFDEPAVNVDAIAPAYRAARDGSRFACLGSRGVYSFVQTMVGDLTILISMIDEPQWVSDMAATTTDAYLKMYQQVLDAGMTPDAIWIHDDLAYRNALFMSPQMYRDLFRPQHKRLVEFAHANGMKFIFHTDGDVREVVADMVDIGVDCLQPMEAKANMDVRDLAPRFGDRLSLFGNIDMTVAITNDHDQVEAELRAKLGAGMAMHGYLYHSDHSVPPQVSWRTYQFIHDLVDRLGVYR